MQRILVDQSDITKTYLEERDTPPLATGQVRMRLQNCALTTNNVTYAATGFVIGYWKFFPSGVDGQGLLPVWGTAEAIESNSADVPVGTRLYGFFPLAEHCVLTPRADAGGTITDTAPHRADLPGVYNRYTPVRPGDARQDHLRALLQPLLATSWLLADWLEDNAFFGAEQVIVGSASSKTGLGLCKYLAEADPRQVRITGLTSATNRAFVAALGACDSVVTYDAIEDLPRVPSVYVDMAGNAEVRARLHAHLDAELRHSCAVGTSHWDKFRPGQNLPGPKPEFFFAPAQISKRRKDWGPGVVEGRISDAVRRLAGDADSWLALRVHSGLAAALPVYADLAAGRAAPRDGHVIDFGTT